MTRTDLDSVAAIAAAATLMPGCVVLVNVDRYDILSASAEELERRHEKKTRFVRDGLRWPEHRGFATPEILDLTRGAEVPRIR